jgi:hypothetical protein
MKKGDLYEKNNPYFVDINTHILSGVPEHKHTKSMYRRSKALP